MSIAAGIPPCDVLDSIIAYPDRLITRQELSRWLGISVDRLSIWAQEGQGPRALRVGLYKTRYRIGDVLEWLAKQDVSGAPTARRGGRKSTPSISGQFGDQSKTA